MIRIQKLKQPKVSSGKEIAPGATLKMRGLEITNTNKFSLWADSYDRKPYKPKKKKKEGKK